jgi:hypothetical protein
MAKLEKVCVLVCAWAGEGRLLGVGGGSRGDSRGCGPPFRGDYRVADPLFIFRADLRADARCFSRYSALA